MPDRKRSIPVTGTLVKKLQGALLAWYDRHARELPWRGVRDPYAIWVSEIMLQQTQVDTVIPYFERFLALFPTVDELARASSDEVMKAFENLGYYARARHLHAAAARIVEQHQGRVPDSAEAILRLPGIGRYTAGAILSIAYDLPLPALDANGKRVLARLFALDRPVEEAQTVQALWDLAGRLVPAERPGDWNQALMDLGSRVCAPRHPACESCPVQKACRASRQGLQDHLPVRTPRKPIPLRHATAVVLPDARGRVLVTKRPDQGLLGGLWKFPGGFKRSGETLKGCLERTTREEVGLHIAVKKPLVDIDHAYTHFRIRLHAFSGIVLSGVPLAKGCPEWRWAPVAELSELAFSKADRQIVLVLRKSV